MAPLVAELRPQRWKVFQVNFSFHSIPNLRSAPP